MGRRQMQKREKLKLIYVKHTANRGLAMVLQPAYIMQTSMGIMSLMLTI